MLTTEQLAEIEKRTDQATPGPWVFEGSVFDWDYRQQTYTMEWIDNRCVSKNQRDADGALMAHARADIPALLEYARQLERMLSEAHDESAGYRQGYLDGQKAMLSQTSKRFDLMSGDFDICPFDAARPVEPAEFRSRGYVGRSMIQLPGDRREIKAGEEVIVIQDGRRIQGVVDDAEGGNHVRAYQVRLAGSGLLIRVQPTELLPVVNP